MLCPLFVFYMLFQDSKPVPVFFFLLTNRIKSLTQYRFIYLINLISAKLQVSSVFLYRDFREEKKMLNRESMKKMKQTNPPYLILQKWNRILNTSHPVACVLDNIGSKCKIMCRFKISAKAGIQVFQFDSGFPSARE